MGRRAKRDPDIEYSAVNIKLRSELSSKIKMLIGQKMAETGVYWSQQDLLSMYIEERVAAEFVINDEKTKATKK